LKRYWGITALKATLKQPDAWLREVLAEVAQTVKTGEYINMWELKPQWKNGNAQAVLGPSSMAGGDEVKDEEQEDDEDSEDFGSDEEDFEEVEA
jgi:transcription initiation factor TFIIF subunit beta